MEPVKCSSFNIHHPIAPLRLCVKLYARKGAEAQFLVILFHHAQSEQSKIIFNGVQWIQCTQISG